MPDTLTALTSLAVATYRERADIRHGIPDWYASVLTSDTALQEILQLTLPSTTQLHSHKEVLELIFAEPEFADIAPREGQLDPMLLFPGGGRRISSTTLIASHFSSAFSLMYVLRLSDDENTFVRTVLDQFEELRRAIKGEKIRVYNVTGIAQFSLPETAQISTPWGTVRPVPPISSVQRVPDFHEPTTSCILAGSQYVPVMFDRAPFPQPTLDATTLVTRRSSYLFPLACVLASKDTTLPIAPLLPWSTLILPLQNGFSNLISQSVIVYTHNTQTNAGEQIAEIEEWARVVDHAHMPSVDISARRLVSAVTHRANQIDSLIDAIIVWENLLGTSRKITARLSEGLAKLLEEDGTRQIALKKELADIYGVRSRLVHGAALDDSTVKKACSDAIDVAVRALRASYLKGSEWLSLSSQERSDTLLLE
jgi:hypothetical protein